MNTPTETSAARIAALNDQCRKGELPNSRIVRTVGVSKLPFADLLAVRKKVATFNTFEEGDNPYGERDFGAFDHNGERIFWKIDYYDPGMEFGSDDPSDPKKTVRVLTIMLADEY